MSLIKISICCLALLMNLQSSYAEEQKIKSSLFSSAIGDALGRVTEFIGSVENQFERYPGGLTSFRDFKESDWENIPSSFKESKIAPYTDDTRMALLVADVLVESCKNKWNKETTMSQIAKAFINDLENSQYGWAAYYRVPGNACIAGVRVLKRKSSQEQSTLGWWDARASNAGGCGSVMRAFPFGLAFSSDPEKAKTWAADHSKITHGAPCALASCAAMALGIAEALRGEKDEQAIIWDMIEAAYSYDKLTADKMIKALLYAQEAKALLISYGGVSLQKAFNHPEFVALHKQVFTDFLGWSAHDALAATIYVFALFPKDISCALYVAVHTPGDSDSIAAMAGALVGAYSGSMPDKSMVDSIEESGRFNALARQLATLK